MGTEKLWIVDYINPHKELTDCLIIEAESYEDAYDMAISQLKSLKIPKRYLLKLEEF